MIAGTPSLNASDLHLLFFFYFNVQFSVYLVLLRAVVHHNFSRQKYIQHTNGINKPIVDWVTFVMKTPSGVYFYWVEVTEPLPSQQT